MTEWTVCDRRVWREQQQKTPKAGELENNTTIEPHHVCIYGGRPTENLVENAIGVLNDR